MGIVVEGARGCFETKSMCFPISLLMISKMSNNTALLCRARFRVVPALSSERDHAEKVTHLLFDNP